MTYKKSSYFCKRKTRYNRGNLLPTSLFSSLAIRSGGDARTKDWGKFHP